MNTKLDTMPSMIDRIRHDLVGLKMPRALEALDHVVRRLEHGELSALEAIDILLSEELTLRENSRIKTALRMGRLATIKTLAGFDFTFQPSLDKDRIFTLAQLGFIERNEAVHFLGPPGTGKSHLATALGVEAVKAGKSVYFSTLADLITSLARAEREGRLREMLCRAQEHALLLGRKTAVERVASAILDLAAQFARRRRNTAGSRTSFTLFLTRADLADWLGLTLETVSRCFGVLKRSKLIAFGQPERITIRDRAALEAIALGRAGRHAQI